MPAQSVNTIIDEIFSLYEQYGANAYAGEKVSQLEHMCQAAQLATSEGCDDEVILAAFFHDIGHLLPVHDEYESMNGYGVVDHEKLGADYLKKLGFGERLCKLVSSHVHAKRYLTYKDESYYDNLSDASKATLEYQGGRMDEEEAKKFESDNLFPLYIRMRRWDEAAKVEHLAMQPIGIFKIKTFSYLQQQSRS